MIKKTFYEDYPTKEFFKTLEECLEKIRVVNPVERGGDYHRVKLQVINFCHSSQNTFDFQSERDIGRVIAVLTQERSSNSNPNNDILENLIQKNKLEILFIAIEKNTPADYRKIICKKLLYFYYSRFHTIEKYSQHSFYHRFKTFLYHLLSHYTGRNRMVNVVREHPYLVRNEFYKLFDKYPNKPLNEICKELMLSEQYEIWEAILGFYFIKQVEQWKSNQEDEQVYKVWDKISSVKYAPYNAERTLIEQVVFLMLEKCYAIRKLGQTWLNWIIKEIGDPRQQRHRAKWIRVGETYFKWVRSIIARGDVRDFLETMTDGHGDEIYQYRRQFWLQYIDYVEYAKVMIARSTLYQIAQKDPEMYKKFKTDPEIYSRLSESERSCIFIDFGKFCVIEGTHNATLRFYNEPPIPLENKVYDYGGFYTTLHAKKFIEKEYSHHYSETYSWQNKVRLYIAKQWGIEVPLKNILLDEDKPSLKHIEQALWRKGEL